MPAHALFTCPRPMIASPAQELELKLSLSPCSVPTATPNSSHSYCLCPGTWNSSSILTQFTIQWHSLIHPFTIHSPTNFASTHTYSTEHLQPRLITRLSYLLQISIHCQQSPSSISHNYLPFTHNLHLIPNSFLSSLPNHSTPPTTWPLM